MTEQGWASSTNPHTMLTHLLRIVLADITSFRSAGREEMEAMYDPLAGVSNRKLQLFAAACWHGVSEDLGKDAEQLILWDSPRAQHAAQWALGWAGDQKKPSPAERAALLRDIFGNPWRPVTLCGKEPWPHSNAAPGWNGCLLCLGVLAWNDGTVPKIAQAIFDERRWEEMPILADALQEADCQEETILRHCRGEERCWKCNGTKTIVDTSRVIQRFEKPLDHESAQLYLAGIRAGLIDHKACDCDTGWRSLRGPHVRGCWVLDLLLGKNGPD